MTVAYIAIGSNLNSPQVQAKQAVDTLKQHPDIEVLAVSPLYTSTPMGPQNQPDYINAVVKVDTILSAEALLDSTQAIEQAQGRIRKDDRWGPRCIDLDLLLYGDDIIDTPRLTVPHYGMKVREFVLYPLYDVAPELNLPDGTPLTQLVSQIDKNGLRIWQACEQNN